MRREDQDLRQAILDELECEPSIEANTIGVMVENGVVTLTGRVESFTRKLTVERCAQRVPGVKAVAEEIEIEIPSLHRRTDADIAEAAVTALTWNAIVPHDRIKVKVEDGWITLTGDLDWGYQKTAAEAAVRDLLGVKGVHNLVSTKKRADATAIKREISRLFHRNIQRDLDHILVETHDGTVQLRGTVSSWAERQEAVKAAWNTPGVAKVENYITINA
ncbi:MAG TPA: BON domain-containing protein [Fimbriimonadaceae bacterium]|nr:BON domain-containing protein [Fimbriimonadaceae bacterium]